MSLFLQIKNKFNFSLYLIMLILLVTITAFTTCKLEDYLDPYKIVIMNKSDQSLEQIRLEVAYFKFGTDPIYYSWDDKVSDYRKKTYLIKRYYLSKILAGKSLEYTVPGEKPSHKFDKIKLIFKSGNCVKLISYSPYYEFEKGKSKFIQITGTIPCFDMKSKNNSQRVVTPVYYSPY